MPRKKKEEPQERGTELPVSLTMEEAAALGASLAFAIAATRGAPRVSQVIAHAVAGQGLDLVGDNDALKALMLKLTDVGLAIGKIEALPYMGPDDDQSDEQAIFRALTKKAAAEDKKKGRRKKTKEPEAAPAADPAQTFKDQAAAIRSRLENRDD